MKRLRATLCVIAALAICSCAPKPAPPPPPPPPAPQNIFALLPEPGVASVIEIRNTAGTRELNQPNTAVQVAGSNVAPGPVYPLTDADVTRLFGSALDVMPLPEIAFTLSFDLGANTLNAESRARIPDILKAIQERRSTLITITGHTDTMPIANGNNYQLGLDRANTVAANLRQAGVKDSDMVISSHGQADLLIQTGPNVDEPKNRRVEVIVR